MAEEVAINISVVGSQEACADIQEYIDSLTEMGVVQDRSAESAGALADAVTSLVGPLSDLVKQLGDTSKASSDAAGASDNLTAAQQAEAAAVEKALAALAEQTGVVEDNAAAMAAAAAAADDFAATENRVVVPTQAQTLALENSTRQLLLQRDAAIEAMASNQKFVEGFTASAPKLTRSALYLTAGGIGLAYEGIKQYMNFNQAMTQTFTQAGVAFSKQKALTQDMADIAKATGRNFDDVANSLYRVASATASWNRGKGATSNQLKTLVGQVTDLQVLGNLSPGQQSEQAARIIGSIANAGMGGSPKSIAAQVNAIVGSGDIRMSELITALGRGVLASGSTVGLNLKQIGAFIDLLTTRGTTGASAGTYVAHAFQLLAGSTAQARKWQAAIGIPSGQLEETMRSKGLTAAAQLLIAKMQKLAATPYLTVTKGYGVLQGQQAADYLMQTSNLSPQEINQWKSGKMDPQTLAAVLQTEMTAMFGGGRQAVPVMTLLQSIAHGGNTPADQALNHALGFKGSQTATAQYQSILQAINRGSTQARYNKDVNKALNTPRVQEQKLLRALQWDLIEFGKAVTPIWLDLLHAAIRVTEFMSKFKGYLVEIGVVIGSILGLVALKELVKGGAALAKMAGAGTYWASRGIGNVEGRELRFRKGSLANYYANKKGLKYGTEWYEKQDQVSAANVALDKSAELLGAAGSKLVDAAGNLDEAAMRMTKGQIKGLSNATWGLNQKMDSDTWNVGPDNIYPVGTVPGEGGAPGKIMGARLLSEEELAQIKAEAASQLYPLRPGVTGASLESALIQKAAPVTLSEEDLGALARKAAVQRWGEAGGALSGRTIKSFEEEARNEFKRTGAIAGVTPYRTVASESARAASYKASGLVPVTANTEALTENTSALGRLTAVAAERGLGGNGGSGRGISPSEETATKGDLEEAMDDATSGAGSKVAAAAEDAGSVVENAGSGLLGMASKLPLVGGMLSGIGEEGLTGALGTVLGIGTGPIGMGIMAALPILGPLLEPSISKGISSLLHGISGLFSGNSTTYYGPSISKGGVVQTLGGGAHGISSNPKKMPKNLKPAALLARKSVLERDADKALRAGNTEEYFRLMSLARQAGNEAVGMAFRPKATEQTIDRRTLAELEHLEKSAGYSRSGFRGAIHTPGFVGPDGKVFSSETIGGYQITPQNIQSRIAYLRKRVPYAGTNYTPPPVSPATKAQLEMLEMSLHMHAGPNKFGAGGVWLGGMHPYFRTGTRGHYQYKTAMDIGGKMYTAAAKYGHLYSPQIDKALRQSDPFAKVKSAASPLASQFTGLSKAAEQLRKEMHHGDSDNGKAAGYQALKEAGEAQKNASEDQLTAIADYKSGNYTAAKMHEQAATQLQQSAKQLTAGVQKMTGHMTIANMNDFEAAMAQALNSAGLNGLASQLGNLGSSVTSAIAIGMKHQGSRA